MKLFSQGIIILIIIFSLSIAQNVMGQNIQRSNSVTPLIGGYLFEGNQHLKHKPLAGLALGHNLHENWWLEAVLHFNPTEYKEDDSDVQAYMYRLDALYDIKPEGKFVPYLAGGLGGITLNPDLGESHQYFLVDYGVGAKYFLNDVSALRCDVRHVIPFNETHHNLSYSLGLMVLFGTSKNRETERHTGIGQQHAEIVQHNDADGDGVQDYQDKCPNTPPNVPVDSFGCPLDTDGDGVYDYKDSCPDTPPKVAVDDSGCPPDTDGDGVYDYQDECLDTPKGVKADTRGCWVIQGILFDTAKWTIKTEEYPSLDQVADIMKQNPSLKLEVQGHTDDRGTQSYNETLSKKRAMSVVEYLVKKGIAKNRLRARGLGSLKPVMSNDTPEGQVRNRRVELAPIH